jgi:hypothetical protein
MQNDEEAATVGLHFAHYNLVRTHSTIKTTPAVFAGIMPRKWSMHELIGAAGW